MRAEQNTGLQARVERVHGGASAALERLWYSIYVDELGHDLPQADHAARRISDPFAASGQLHVAHDPQGTPVGSVLTVLAGRTDPGHYRELYGLEGDLSDVAFTTRLVVAPSHRRSRVARELTVATYRDGLEAGVRTAHVDVQPMNQKLFERMGYVLRGPVTHPLYGPSLHMTLDLHDVEHMRRVRSPFLKIATEYLGRTRRRASVTPFVGPLPARRAG